MIRAVIDTSILIRALIKPRGTVGPILQALRDADYQLVYSDPLLAELTDVLTRPRLAKKYGVTTEDVATVLSLILLRGEPVLPVRRIDACRDPMDNMVMEAAVAGQVDFIVSGGKDLLTLSPFERIPVLSPAAFLRRLASERRRA
ncbi:MAG: putative toxin-antitoxin system toxin component, PIN family [Chloroflexi bacterium]|nr:putative toxin-antitoxin system toxin component, PIN family [Chloroflexota bacterium]